MRVLLLTVILASPLVAEEKKKDVTKLTRYVGYLPTRGVYQHPRLSLEKQSYFDVYQKGKMTKQIITLFKRGVKEPTKEKTPIELQGVVSKIDLGGKQGTKLSYKGEVMTVHRGRYLKKLPKK